VTFSHPKHNLTTLLAEIAIGVGADPENFLAIEKAVHVYGSVSKDLIEESPHVFEGRLSAEEG
jgi:hypothetical protein